MFVNKRKFFKEKYKHKSGLLCFSEVKEAGCEKKYKRKLMSRVMIYYFAVATNHPKLVGMKHQKLIIQEF